MRLTITITAAAFWKIAASMDVYYRKTAALVFILSQEASKQLASIVMTGDDPTQVCVPSSSNKNVGNG